VIADRAPVTCYIRLFSVAFFRWSTAVPSSRDVATESNDDDLGRRRTIPIARRARESDNGFAGRETHRQHPANVLDEGEPARD